MSKDVLISIKGMHFDSSDVDDGDIEVIQQGKYYFKDGAHYLMYDEPVQNLSGANTKIRSLMKIDSDSMSLTKQGPFASSMLFDKSRKNLTNYFTPFGSIVLGIDTHNIVLNSDEKGLSVDVEYSLDVNYEFLAECNIHIVATTLTQ